jgi:hypothetical protein
VVMQVWHEPTTSFIVGMRYFIACYGALAGDLTNFSHFLAS